MNDFCILIKIIKFKQFNALNERLNAIETVIKVTEKVVSYQKVD